MLKNSKFRKFSIIFDRFDYLTLLICFIYYTLWQNINTYRFYHFGYYDWDFALYSQVMWSLIHNSLTPSLFGVNFLTNHSQFITFLLTPLYYIFPTPLLLINLKILALVGGGFIFYKIAREEVGASVSCILMLLYFLHPANIFLLFYEFHFESLALPLIFLIYWSFKKQNFRTFVFIGILLCLIKENLPLIFAMFGIIGLISPKHKNKWQWFVFPFIFGLTYFAFIMEIFTPWIRQNLHSSNQYLGYYSHAGGGRNSLIQILIHLFLNPGQLVTTIFNPKNQSYLNDLFSPTLYLSLFNPITFIPALPIAMQHLLSSSGNMKKMYFHYAPTLLPFIYVSCIYPINYLMKKKYIFALILLIIAIFISHCIGINKYESSFSNRISKIYDSHTSNILWHMIDKMEEDAGVIASIGLLTPLSQRTNLQSFYDVTRNANVFSGKAFLLSDKINYALLNLNEIWDIYDSEIIPYDSLKSYQEFYYKNNWSVIDAYGSLVLLENNPGKSIKLVEKSDQTYLQNNTLFLFEIPNAIQLLSVEYNLYPLLNNKTLPFTFYWKSLNDITKFVHAKIILRNDTDQSFIFHRRLGSFFEPTINWKKGDYIKENIWLPTDYIPPGKYDVYMSLSIRPSNNSLLLSYKTNSGDTVEAETVKIGEILLNQGKQHNVQ